MVVEQVGLHAVGLKLVLTPAGRPVAENVTDWVGPPIRVAETLAVVLPPADTVAWFGVERRL